MEQPHEMADGFLFCPDSCAKFNKAKGVLRNGPKLDVDVVLKKKDEN